MLKLFLEKERREGDCPAQSFIGALVEFGNSSLLHDFADSALAGGHEFFLEHFFLSNVKFHLPRSKHISPPLICVSNSPSPPHRPGCGECARETTGIPRFVIPLVCDPFPSFLGGGGDPVAASHGVLPRSLSGTEKGPSAAAPAEGRGKSGL